MQNGMWHVARATIVLASLWMASPVHAQEDCLECTSGTGAATDAGNGNGYNCFKRAGCCDGKACYWYRPMTEGSQPDVFYNLYVPNNLGAAAAAYPAPYPTPSLIGHVYYTYQPLMPHEMLYKHHRTYYQHYNGGMGLNRTTVNWGGTPIRTSLKSIGKALSLPH